MFVLFLKQFQHSKIFRWLDYDPVGRDIPGTRIVAFKTPLSPSFFIGMEEEDDERFEVRTLMNYVCFHAAITLKLNLISFQNCPVKIPKHRKVIPLYILHLCMLY